MKRCALVCLACAAVAFWSVAALAEDNTPWAKAGAEKADQPAAKAPDAKAPADVKAPAVKAGGDVMDLKTTLSEAQYKSLITPITAALEQADKLVDSSAKELAKDKPNEKRALDYKVQAARFFLTASQKAKQSVAAVKEDTVKAAITTQYEKPSLDKAIAIYLEVADAAMKVKDYKAAEAEFKRVLQLDKDNATAKEGLAKIDAEKKAAAEAAKKGGPGGGNDPNSWVPGMQQVQDPTGSSAYKKGPSTPGQPGYKGY